jgi:ATP-binding cassette subfamily F protein 3
MLAVSHLTKSFNLQTLFDNVTFSINPNERVGLIGSNGCGKTTLLRILAGLEEADGGQVHKPANLRIGYLPQGFELPTECAIAQIVNNAVGDVEALNAELVALSGQLAEQPANQNLAERYDDLLQRIQAAEPRRAARIVAGLGLENIPQDLPAGNLSGGQKTRLSLALLLLQDPELLLLDEPTNHLDIAMLEWLEEWLKNTRCGALIVSHDRMFLDRTVARILELDASSQRLRSYEGNYSAYLEQKEAGIEAQWSAYNDQKEEIRRVQADIARVKEQAKYTERQASANHTGDPEKKFSKDFKKRLAKKVARKAAAREKRLERYKDSDERVEKPKGPRSMRVEFENAPHLGRSVIQMERLSVGFAGFPPLLEHINLQVHASQRIAFTGPNGCGKTTLLRTLAGELAPLAGRVLLGSSVHVGWMSQDLSALILEKSALEHVWEYFPNQTEARRFLGYYLITGDEVLKPSSQLSFGQRARLMLALLVVRGCNVLLLDEPINHLDIPSRTRFEQALRSFSGAILMVVHDRYFIERFAQEIWQVQDKRIIQNSNNLSGE